MMKAEVGDWVCFYHGGQLVIGVVAYRTTNAILGGIDLSTTAGRVDEEDILEVRRKGAGK